VIPPIAKGYKRQWLRCRRCQRVQFYDYVPYSLSNPIMTTACGHGATERDLGCDSISADEALVALLAANGSSDPSDGGVRPQH
jgi:hypothetical protein